MEVANAMEVFVTVVDQGSFSAAARLLGVPTSTVSRQVSRMEDRLNTRLLHRTTRKLSPTDAGRTYYERAKQIVVDIQEAENAVVNLQGVPTGNLRIAAAPTSAREHFLKSLVPAFLLRYPQVTCDVVVASRFVDLVEEGFDLALRGGTLDDSSLVARKLARACMGAVASPAYLEAHGRPESVDDLTDHSCILYRSHEGPTRWPLYSGKSVAVTGRLVSNDMGLITGAVIQGLGIGVMPLGFVGPELEDGTVEQVLPGVVGKSSQLQFVYPSGRHLPAKVRAFIDFSIEHLAEHPLPSAGPSCPE